MDFSTIIQTPEVRALVQEGYLERAFHDSLFPMLVYRGDVVPIPWPNDAGDTYIMTAPGLMDVKGTPLAPGRDPDPGTYPLEQWEVGIKRWAGSIDTHMPTSVMAIQNLLMENTAQLGKQAARTLNRLVRNKLFAVGESGWTVADGAGVASTSLRVKRLNGFTKARSAASTGVNRVRFSDISASNPLAVSLAGSTVSVVAVTPDTPGDEMGPGVLTLSASATWSDRAYVKAFDATDSFNVGGGNKVDDLGNSDLPTLQDVRTAVTRLRRNNVPVHPDGNYHAHIGPDSEALIFADTEIQRMLQSRPEHYMYADFVIGRILNTVFVSNTEAPVLGTVHPYDATFSQDDAFPAELTNNGLVGGMQVHRVLFTGHQVIQEYYQDPSMYDTEAGLVGKAGSARVTNNGIELNVERVRMIMRAPLNRLQDQVATSWIFVGGWATRTDAMAPGTPARYKRSIVMRHGAPA